jgi:hypothetical protein
MPLGPGTRRARLDIADVGLRWTSLDFVGLRCAVVEAERERLPVQRIRRAGLTAKDAAQFATTLVAASEEAVALSRTEQHLEHFDLVADHLLAQVRSMTTQ